MSLLRRSRYPLDCFHILGREASGSSGRAVRKQSRLQYWTVRTLGCERRLSACVLGARRAIAFVPPFYVDLCRLDMAQVSLVQLLLRHLREGEVVYVAFVAINLLVAHLSGRTRSCARVSLRWREGRTVSPPARKGSTVRTNKPSVRRHDAAAASPPRAIPPGTLSTGGPGDVSEYTVLLASYSDVENAAWRRWEQPARVSFFFFFFFFFFVRLSTFSCSKTLGQPAVSRQENS